MVILARGFVFNEKGDFVAQTVSLRQQAEQPGVQTVSRSNRLTSLGYMMVGAKTMDSVTEGTFADSAGDKNGRSLQIFRRGSAHFALATEEIAVIADWRQPTPLPQAPPAVLGVVSVSGRMLTVLDPAVLLERTVDGSNATNFIVALRGDEQLALIVDELGETLTAEIDSQDTANGATLGVVRHQDNMIGILDLTKLFGLAIRGRERRQRAFEINNERTGISDSRIR